MAKVSQGIEAASRSLKKWESGLEGAPSIGASETTEDLKAFMPLFEELLTDRMARVRKEEAEKIALQQPEEEVQSLLTPEQGIV